MRSGHRARSPPNSVAVKPSWDAGLLPRSWSLSMSCRRVVTPSLRAALQPLEKPRSYLDKYWSDGHKTAGQPLRGVICVTFGRTVRWGTSFRPLWCVRVSESFRGIPSNPEAYRAEIHRWPVLLGAAIAPYETPRPRQLQCRGRGIRRGADYSPISISSTSVNSTSSSWARRPSSRK